MSEVLIHHGVKGQKWGVRRYQNRDGSRTQVGKARLRKSYSPEDTVFISGKVKYDQPLDDSLKKEVDKIIKSGSKIVIGDAPGADTRVQDYLASKGYSNVVVYTTDKKVRNNVGNWKVQRIRSNGYSDEKSIRQQKDIAMTRASTRGLAIMPFDDRPDSAMSLNVQRMNEQGTPVLTYDYNDGLWHNDIFLMHHGVKGQKWGVRRYQNSDGSLTALGKKRYGTQDRLESERMLKEYKNNGIIPKNAQAQNLASWGRNPNTNVLYISGMSGSGKSTIALRLKDKNTEVIHLDSYFDNPDGPQSKDFNDYLKSIKSDYKKISLPKDKITMNEWGKIVERFEQDIEQYGKNAYGRNKKVIVEGVHMLDDTIRPNKKYFVDKPFILLNTNILSSTIRANRRDEKNFSVNDITNRLSWQRDIRNVRQENNFHHSGIKL